jgi:STE24 endopeptidase
MILTPIEIFVGIGMNFISRKFEWEADAFACELHGKVPGVADVVSMGERLGKALTTIHVENLSTVWVDWLYVLSPDAAETIPHYRYADIRQFTIHIRH